MKTYTNRKPLLRIELGELVQDRRGRIGRTTQVNLDFVYIRFAEGEKAKMVYRNEVTPLSFIRAMAEVDEDERNAAAYMAQA